MIEMIPVDEMVDGRGGVRPHWRHLLSAVSDLGHRELMLRRQQIALALSDQTGTPVPGDVLRSPGRAVGATPSQRPAAGKEPERSLACDPVPLLLRADEFAFLERGVIQRACLLEALLRDVHGERLCLDEHLLPPALVWANRGFLRGGVAESESPLPERFLSFYAVDLVRGPDGEWRVLSDRVARANGIGLALENRRQMNRFLPELSGGRALRRLHPFLEHWQETLQQEGFADSASPGLALLTPGPSSPHWGEHVILARELGCVLAEAGDLTVREGELWLKTVRGLRRVDVLLIRQDGDSIDPLELEGSGAAGISGLLDAARGGSVRLMNDPRAGFVEAAGLTPFLPALAPRFLGEELCLDGLEMLWLGDDAGRACLEDVLPLDLAIAPRPGWAIASALGEKTDVQRPGVLDPQERLQLAEKVHAAPWRYVAYREPVASVAPTIADNGIVPKPVVLRLFAAHDGTGWFVLPGGLGRVVTEGAPVPMGTIPGALLTKDVWVSSDEMVAPRESLPLLARPLPIRRAQGDLPSRAADDFFWLGRYLEQLEGAARLLNVTLDHMPGTDLSPRERVDLDMLLRQMRATDVISELPFTGYGVSNIVRTLAAAQGTEGLFVRVLRKILRLVPELADRFTREMRDFITHNANGLLADMAARPHSGDTARAVQCLRNNTGRMLAYGATLSGLAAENMVRSGGRQFLDLGRRIERASAVLTSCAGILDQPGVQQRGRMEGALRLMLELCDSVITYRSRYFNVMQPAPVLDLLLLDEDNPRGAGFQIASLRDSLLELASDGSTAPLAQRRTSVELATAAGEILTMLSTLVTVVMEAGDQDREAARLPEALRQAQARLLSLAEQIGRCYFSVLNSPRLVGFGSDGTVEESEVPT